MRGLYAAVATSVRSVAAVIGLSLGCHWVSLGVIGAHGHTVGVGKWVDGIRTHDDVRRT